MLRLFHFQGHSEMTGRTLNMHQRPPNIYEGTHEVQRNSITQQQLAARASLLPQDTHPLPPCGTRGILKGNQLPEDHMFHPEDREWLTNRHFQDHPTHLTSIGNRPTFLQLQNRTTATSANSQEEQRRRGASDIQMVDDSLAKGKGIIASFKDIFKGPKRN